MKAKAFLEIQLHSMRPYGQNRALCIRNPECIRWGPSAQGDLSFVGKQTHKPLGVVRHDGSWVDAVNQVLWGAEENRLHLPGGQGGFAARRFWKVSTVSPGALNWLAPHASGHASNSVYLSGRGGCVHTSTCVSVCVCACVRWMYLHAQLGQEEMKLQGIHWSEPWVLCEAISTLLGFYSAVSGNPGECF